MATKKNTATTAAVVYDSVDDIDNSVYDSVDNIKKVEDNDTGVDQTAAPKARIIHVVRVENKDLEVTLQRIGYENVAQILVEPSLGFALFNVIYWSEEEA